MLGLDGISQSLLEVLFLFDGWDLETDNSVNEFLVLSGGADSVEGKWRGFFSVNLQCLLRFRAGLDFLGLS